MIDEGAYGGGSLADKNIDFFPRNEVTIQPRESFSLQIIFNPTKRIKAFSEDLFITYAGLKRTLLTVTGRAQGTRELWLWLVVMVNDTIAN
jgi:hypothetical protein